MQLKFQKFIEEDIQTLRELEGWSWWIIHGTIFTPYIPEKTKNKQTNKTLFGKALRNPLMNTISTLKFLETAVVVIWEMLPLK